MTFTEGRFLLFFFAVLIGYYVLPRRMRYLLLLAASLYFYSLYGVRPLLTLLFVSGVTWCGGRWIGRADRRTGKYISAGCAVAVFGLLFLMKYLPFAVQNVNRGLRAVGAAEIGVPNVFAPVGASFFTFQAMSYVFDVYRGAVKPERNFLRYLLFVAFFPTLLSGPIQKAGERLQNFSAPSPENGNNVVDTVAFRWENVRGGLVLALWGLFIKLVVSDRLTVLVDTVFAPMAGPQGFLAAVGAAANSLWIYFDFSAYSLMAIGIARTFGFCLSDNFRRPYFAVSIRDFWRRWHISLSTWFRDYLYIPLGGNRRGTARKQWNVMLVFLVSGLWHGAGWSFVIWGLLHGAFQVLGERLLPARKRVCAILGIDRDKPSFRFGQRLAVFALATFAWIFFRAESTLSALHLIKNMFSVWNPWVLVDGTLYTLGLGEKDLLLTAAACLAILFVDAATERTPILQRLEEQNLVFRWCVYLALLFAVLVFGRYGPAYDAGAFVYFRF